MMAPFNKYTNFNKWKLFLRTVAPTVEFQFQLETLGFLKKTMGNPGPSKS